MTRRYGMTVPFAGPLVDQAERFRALVDLGYTDAWTAESDGYDGLTPLALASIWAPELRLGTAILPVFTRGPALLAQSAASMAAAAPGPTGPTGPLAPLTTLARASVWATQTPV